MIYERFVPLTLLRCTCGKIGTIPEELRRLFTVAPKPADYVLVEKLTGFKVLFPDIPAHKIVWLCPDCWKLVGEQARQIAKKLGGLWHFSLTQLTEMQAQEIAEASNRFVEGTDRWRGKRSNTSSDRR